MATVRRNRKITDQEVIRMNKLGYSIQTIAKIYNCHPSAVSARLKSLNIPPANARHAFMESVLSSLPSECEEHISKLFDSNPNMTIKDYIQKLILNEVSARQETQASLPAAA